MVEEVQIDDLAAPKQDARIEEEDKDDDDDLDDAITVTPKVKQPPVEEIQLRLVRLSETSMWFRMRRRMVGRGS